MELIKSISAAMFLLLAAWMIYVVVCQFMALRYVPRNRHWLYKKAIRKWQFAEARTVVEPAGLIWLDRVEQGLRAGMVVLGIAAFAAVAIMLFGPDWVGEGTR
ncbi:MAG: hypothetical protein ACFCUN_01470 [Hyphomicrobiaceae bacterium]